jgi:hypothetical protein
MEMPPQGAPAPAPEPQGEAQGPATKLVVSIHDDMGKLMQIIQRGNQVPPQVQQRFANLISQYEQLVEEAMGSGEPPAEPEASGPVPMESGNAKTQPAL